MKKILAFLKPYKKQFVVSQILMIIATISGLFFPWIIRNIFDNLLSKSDYQRLIVLIGVLTGLFIISHITNYFKDIKLGIIGEKIVKDIRIKLFEKLQRLSIGFYSKHKSGDIVSRITNDINLFQSSLSTGLTYLLRQSIALIFITFMLFKIDWVLTIIVFSMFPFIYLISKNMGLKAKQVSKRAQKKLGELTSLTNESISGMNVIKTFVLENVVKRMYREENEKLLKHSIDNIKIKAKSNFFIGIFTSIQFLSLIGVGAYRAFNNYISPGDLIAFLLYVQMIIGPISMLSNLYIDIQKSMAAISRVFEILNSDEEIRDQENSIELKKANGNIKFDQVYFSYNSENKILENTSFSIEAGSKIALVGKSGAGKSTIINLIPRFYELDKGEIFIDEINIKNIKVKSLRENIAIVPQDTYLFGMSIKDNIYCGNPDASFNEIVDAAIKANAHDFILEFKDGYDTVVGERGCTLSGGQRQRIAIARAFLKNPKILLLDEATSSLDSYSEVKVIEALFELMKDRTTITIAHRLSTIINADCIYVIDGGKIIGKGSHEELFNKCEYYKHLYLNQYKKTI